MATAMALSACASAAPPAGPPAEPTSTSSSTTTTTAPAGRPSDEQIAIFVANVVETLGTESYAAAVEEDPLPFVTSGALMCELLDTGASPTEILVQFLDSFGPTPADAESALAGALLGSAVNAFCPQHRQLLTDDLG